MQLTDEIIRANRVQCKHCHAEKPVCDFRQFKTKTGKPTLVTICRDCEKINGIKVPLRGSEAREYERTHGKVYFAYAPEVNRFKIGYTAVDPMARLSSMQGESPVEIFMIGYIKGTQTDEANLQLKFSNFQYHREWFVHCDEIVSLIFELIDSGQLTVINESVFGSQYEIARTNSIEAVSDDH